MITQKKIVTHRGLEPSQPDFFSESSYEAFNDQLSRGFAGIEFDPNPTKDGIVVLHDATLERPTNGRDTRAIAELTTKQVISTPLDNGRYATLDEVMDLIRQSNSTFNALHLKSRLQTTETLEKIIAALSSHVDIFKKLIVFDVNANTARLLKAAFPSLRLAPSLAHPYDIARYNKSVGGTLMTIDEALDLRKKLLIDGIWADEWDTQGENESTKQFYTKENFDRLHASGLFIAVVTPELHGTSPGLYGGESHADAKNKNVLMSRIKQIKDAGADYFCTDYPTEVAKL